MTVPAPQTSPRRRAVALASTVAVIAALNFVILGSLVAGGDDAAIVAHRFDSTRAFLAAESGAALVIGEVSAGRTAPIGERLLPTGQRILIETDSQSLPMTVEITGFSGDARRVIRISID